MAVMSPAGRIHALDKLHSGMNHGAVGCEFSVNQSTAWSIQKKGEEIHQSVHEATPEGFKANIYGVMEKDGKVTI